MIPLKGLTKGEVLRQAAALLPAGAAELLFASSHSCGKPSWFRGYSQGEHCGLCYGCLVRRASFRAAGLADRTLYIENDLRGTPRRATFATPVRRKTVEAVRYRLQIGYSEADVLAMSLPARVRIADALRLVRDGMEELRPIVDSMP